MKKLVFMHACEFEPRNIGATGLSVHCYQSNVEVFPKVINFFIAVAWLVYMIIMYCLFTL